MLKKLVDYLFETKGLKRIGCIQTSAIVTSRKFILKYPFTKDLLKHQDWVCLLKIDKLPTLQILQVEQPLVIYHFDVPKTDRIGLSNHWRFSESWLCNHRSDFGKFAYENFLLDTLLPGILTDNSLSKKNMQM